MYDFTIYTIQRINTIKSDIISDIRWFILHHYEDVAILVIKKI